MIAADPVEEPRLLLLARTAPGDGNVGQLFLRDLCRSWPQEKLAFGTVTQSATEEASREFAHVPGLRLVIPELRRVRTRPAAVGAVLSHLAYRAEGWRHDSAVVRDLVRFGRQQNVEKVWAVLDSPMLYRVAPRVAAELDVPLASTIWDPPEGVCLQLGIDRLSRRLARRQFVHALQSSERCGVISERMARAYGRLYGTDNVVVRHGISAADVCRRERPEDGELHIGFCGSLYAEAEWVTLLQALDHLQWRVGRRRVRLIVAGSRIPVLRSRSAAHVEYLGWRDMHEVVERMANCDFGYFPYWFNEAYADSVRLCFGTKLTTYMTAGLPVLYHGPRDAALVDFFGRFDVANCCHQLDPVRLSQTIEQMADPASRACMANEVERAVAEELNERVFHERFRELVGGPPPAAETDHRATARPQLRKGDLP
ncbi:MAG: glycosyltransferase [Maioricimonas sp. JB049]